MGWGAFTLGKKEAIARLCKTLQPIARLCNPLQDFGHEMGVGSWVFAESFTVLASLCKGLQYLQVSG